MARYALNQDAVHKARQLIDAKLAAHDLLHYRDKVTG